MALTPEQLELRRSGIGGSDASVVLNINPFRTPLHLFYDKRPDLAPVVAKESEPDEENASLKWGSYLEDPICDAYSDKTGYKLIRQNQMLRSEKNPFMIANLDRRIVGEDRRIGFEAKSDAFGYGWGPDGSDEIPPYIMVQVQHYLAVTGWDEFHLGCLIGNRDFRTYRIMPIEDIMVQLIDAERDFWDRVQAGVAPEMHYEHRATTALLKQLYPGTNGSVIRLPDIAQAYADAMKDASDQRKMFDDVVQGCKNRIAMLLGEASAGVLPDGSCFTRKEVKRASYTVEESSYMDMRRVTKLPKLVTDALENNAVIELENNHG